MPAPTVDTQGTLLQRGDTASPIVYTTIVGVKQIDPIGIGKALRDITTLADTAARQHKLGLADVPEISCECIYDPTNTQQDGLFSDHANNTTRSFRVVIPDSPTVNLDFTALVINPVIGSPDVDGDIMLRFSLKPQSVPSGLY